MTKKQPVVLVDIIRESVKQMKCVPYINFDAGRNIQIVSGLIRLDDSRTLSGTKYPLIALQIPEPEDRGTGATYATVKVRRIIIAALTDQHTPVLKRYEAGGLFKSVLYPMYYEFLECLAQHIQVGTSDPDAFKHTKFDNPGAEMSQDGLSDYVDAIEILNLELTLNQIKTC